MINNGLKTSVHYPITSEEDELWGLNITTVGHQNIDEKEVYPPENHSILYFQAAYKYAKHPALKKTFFLRL